jgi:hypothetical protein
MHSSRQNNGISDKGTHFLFLETFTIVFRQMFACRSSYGLIADHVGIFLQRWSPAKETWTPSQGEEVSGMCGCGGANNLKTSVLYRGVMLLCPEKATVPEVLDFGLGVGTRM